MSILDQIILHKRKEVNERKNTAPTSLLETSALFRKPAVSLKEYICRNDKSGIIAEFKRQSPSKGVINANASVEQTTIGYARAGASALSVLTDEHFFGGTNEDLIRARRSNAIPILRKDFTIDEYQITEAKSIGADAILLIAAVLNPHELKVLTAFAHSLKLEVLLEVHNEAELLASLDAEADLIGVNNRDLNTFNVSVDVSKKLSSLIPDGVVKVSESGIANPGTIMELKKYGYQGFLVGENFMKQANPGSAAAEFIRQLNELIVSSGK